MQVSLNTDDPTLRETLIDVLQNWRPHGSAVSMYEEIAAEFFRRISAAPEPSEPPPGPYQDQDGSVWYRTSDDDGQWRQDACNSWLSWAQAKNVVTFPLVPLFSVDELIPNPDDRDAVNQLGREATDANHAPVFAGDVQAVLVALRARAEARGPQNDGGNS